jgi:hypothetical protein
MNTKEEIESLRNEFDMVLLDSSSGYDIREASRQIRDEARELVETSDNRHTIVVPDNIDVVFVDGGVWLPVMLYIGD